MAAPAREPSFDILGTFNQPWTAQLALDLLPDHDGPGDDLFIPDLAVLRRSGGGRKTMPIGDAVLLGEILSSGNRRKDLVDRPREYAEAGVPWFLRVDARNRVPGLVLHELVDGVYRPVVAAAAGTTFTMTAPFRFSVDPAELLGDAG